ncbi:hypothetical protein N7508_006535 [Penicillium antarcticum]|uniref:uncharacterized protein n=1 Tax=Penicillium antarcticum TaxID=416450 RepID=UPI00239627FF|nr:uncharacterized protein N7508_006535 [Penicillium antarcticum]KAJ5301672.1 hypothetical protein N7508_006535 [Penicillium antarcticum]
MQRSHQATGYARQFAIFTESRTGIGLEQGLEGTDSQMGATDWMNLRGCTATAAIAEYSHG